MLRSLPALAIVAFVGFGATMETWAAPPAAAPERASAWLDAANQALVAGDVEAAARAADLAWLYLSPVFETAWRRRKDDRTALREALGATQLRVAAERARPIVTAMRDDVVAKLAEAPLARKTMVRVLGEAIEDARSCHARAAELGLTELAAECDALIAAATQAEAAARAALEARDRELRALLSGERLTIYEEHGEPDGVFATDDVKAIARAATWTYVIGPTGALRTYERLVFTFKGNRVVSRKRTTSHEQP